MPQTEQTSFFVSQDFTDDHHPTLVCGGEQRHSPSAAGRLGACSVSILTHPTEDIGEFGGKEIVATLTVPSGPPGGVMHGHGLHCFVLLDFAADLDWDHLWYVHYDVHLAGDWEEFFRSFEDSAADFIAPCLRNREGGPDWYWWDSLDAPEGADLPEPEHQLAADTSIFRISRRAYDEVRSEVIGGWTGHSDVILPTMVARAGFSVEDIGGTGPYTPAARHGLHYNTDTFRSHRVEAHVPGFLHHPLLPPASAPSPLRFRPATADIPKILYFSPIGPASVGLLPDVVSRFREASADFLLVEYQASEVVYPPGCTVVKDKGQKWELVRRHLHPEAIKDYDYVFVWDDDIGIADFDPLRFLKIMESNRLDVAQPSLVSPHRICHPITRQKPCPPPLGDLGRVGRLTNFVEIMVPVFTRESWAEFYSYLSPASLLGWGMDSLLLGRKGIVDGMHVVHTRACSQYGMGAVDEMREFLNAQGLFECRHQELGYLLEAPRQAR